MHVNPSLLPEFLMQGLGPISFIGQNPAAAIICQQFINTFNIRNIGRSQAKGPDHSDLGNLQMQLVPKERLTKPFAVTGRALKQFAVFGTNKLADLKRHAIENLQPPATVGLQVFPKRFFDLPEIGRLSHKVAAVWNSRKQIMPMLLEIMINTFVFLKSFKFSDDLHGYYFTVGHLRQRPARTKLAPWKIFFAKIINCNKVFYDKVYQLHLTLLALWGTFVSSLFNQKNSSELAPGLSPEGKVRETIGFSNTEFLRSKDSSGASFIKGKQEGLLKSSSNRNRIPRSLLRGEFIVWRVSF